MSPPPLGPVAVAAVPRHILNFSTFVLFLISSFIPFLILLFLFIATTTTIVHFLVHHLSCCSFIIPLSSPSKKWLK